MDYEINTYDLTDDELADGEYDDYEDDVFVSYDDDELVDFGYDILTEFTTWADENTPEYVPETGFELANISVEGSRIFLEISGDDMIISAFVYLDPQKIDIQEYRDDLLAKLKTDYLQYITDLDWKRRYRNS